MLFVTPHIVCNETKQGDRKMKDQATKTKVKSNNIHHAAALMAKGNTLEELRAAREGLNKGCEYYLTARRIITKAILIKEANA